MSNAHNIGIAVLGFALILMGNVFLNIVGVVMVAWGVGQSLHHYHLIKHIGPERTEEKVKLR